MALRALVSQPAPSEPRRPTAHGPPDRTISPSSRAAPGDVGLLTCGTLVTTVPTSDVALGDGAAGALHDRRVRRSFVR